MSECPFVKANSSAARWPFITINQTKCKVAFNYYSLCTRRLFNAPVTQVLRTRAHCAVDDHKAVLSATKFRHKRASSIRRQCVKNRHVQRPLRVDHTGGNCRAIVWKTATPFWTSSRSKKTCEWVTRRVKAAWRTLKAKTLQKIIWHLVKTRYDWYWRQKATFQMNSFCF